MPLLCFGGSFNPIHVGHVICARVAAEKAGLDGVRLLPTASNPHKPAAGLAAAADRLAMCQLAVGGDPFFTVDDRELRLPGPSFTFDTAATLKPPVAWLIGADLLPRLHTWHRFDELIETVQFVVMHRGGQLVDLSKLDPRVATICTTIVEVPRLEISSTAIRDRIQAGLSVDGFVAPAVARYIANQDLYRAAAAPTQM